MDKKYVYEFNEGDETMRELLGGKGANLAGMSKLGMPVPYGFTITTEACNQYYEDNETIECDYRMLGEIFVSIPKMKGQAIEYGHSETRELAFLVVHGILHLLGYDHTLGEKEEKEMFSRQELVLNEFEETRKA